MTNNDILRRLRFSFEFNDKKLIALFALANYTVDEEKIRAWLKKEDESGYINLNDHELACFLNGLIIEKRGAKEGVAVVNEKRLNNNIILTKLKIALNLQSEDIITLLSAIGFNITKPELSAFFRKHDHKNFRECKDQVMRNMLQAIQQAYRVSPLPKAKNATADNTTSPTRGKATNYQAQSNQSGENQNKTARKGVGKIYINPKATVKEKAEPSRKVLKLKPEDIWKSE